LSASLLGGRRIGEGFRIGQHEQCTAVLDQEIPERLGSPEDFDDASAIGLIGCQGGAFGAVGGIHQTSELRQSEVGVGTRAQLLRDLGD
jgi:hypothetical protein